MFRFASSVLTLLLLLLVGAWPAAAQYPERPLTILSGYPAGGMVDIVARALAEGLKKKYPKGVGVVTRPGGGGSLAVAELVQAKPDGYTVILAPISTLVIHPQLNDLPYKTPDDYESIINTVAFYSLIAVKADAPWKTMQELVAAAKANPGKLRAGSPGEGTSSHLNLEELKRLAGVNITHVPFAGWGESSPALLGGHIESVVAQPGEVRPLVEGGKLRALMVFQAKRNPVFPDVPTAKELGWDAASGDLVHRGGAQGHARAGAEVHPRRHEGGDGGAAVHRPDQAAGHRDRLPRGGSAQGGRLEGVQVPHRGADASGDAEEEVAR